jgi:hypothetical protein
MNPTHQPLSAIARAEQMFDQHFPDRLFVQDVALYLRHGFLINMPRLFVMARPVRKDARLFHAIERPSVRFPDPDAWFVCMAVGNLRELGRWLPFPLPHVCFYRKFRDTLKVYAADEFFRRCAL